ncbi:ketosamine-3-kinase-like [Uloborus diversus]|uniref:ketosamine-3-kinase-like n=1 Tax=Uloborus diversus TaxID=327109 RepID=UPI002408FD34|nr:ketosamine-3-kinase-like [Uloborus diversus]XP_054710441.1 ketosamine-3-kinase-like [Uloborus diversus]
MEAKLKSALGLTFVKSKGTKAGGCISEGRVYETDQGLIFVKVNNESKAITMFEGEVESLKSILETNTVKVPKPLEVIKLNSSGAAVAMEYIDMSGLSKYAELLGEQLAKMHLHNASLKCNDSSVHKSKSESPVHIDQFGFHCTTCCGYIPQVNSWKSDWFEFYAQQRLGHQLQLIETNFGDREARELWSELSLKLSKFFKDIVVVPSLLHGDLWSGNVAEINEGPVIFDPASFYGHSEYELAIADMFGGFPKSFYNSYHSVLPKQIGFDKRKDVYKLFHCLNHWNHFGGGYRSSSISIMKRLLKDD